MTIPIEDDYGCCTLDPGHDGRCQWYCSDCGGTGRCLECDAECHCDDVVHCEWCEGTHECLAGCYEGIVTDEGLS